MWKDFENNYLDKKRKKKFPFVIWLSSLMIIAGGVGAFTYYSSDASTTNSKPVALSVKLTLPKLIWKKIHLPIFP